MEPEFDPAAAPPSLPDELLPALGDVEAGGVTVVAAVGADGVGVVAGAGAASGVVASEPDALETVAVELPPA